MSPMLGGIGFSSKAMTRKYTLTASDWVFLNTQNVLPKKAYELKNTTQVISSK